MKKHNREKQADVLRRTQAQRREQKKEQVLKAIQQLQESEQPLTFSNIAKVAGCSVSYLYKWQDITAYIHDLQNQDQTKLYSLEEKPVRPHSLKTLHEVSKQRIRELELEIKELKHQNEQLRGHVTEIFELREECERLRTQLREMASSKQSTKVVSLQLLSKENVNAQIDENFQEIVKLIEDMGIKVGVKLKEEIARHDANKVKLSIEAFSQYSDKTPVENPAGCLLSMIRSEAEPNVCENKTSYQNNQILESQVVTSTEQHQKKLVPLDQLKKLSTIFDNKDER
jgi:cytochrome c556